MLVTPASFSFATRVGAASSAAAPIWALSSGGVYVRSCASFTPPFFNSSKAGWKSGATGEVDRTAPNTRFSFCIVRHRRTPRAFPRGPW